MPHQRASHLVAPAAAAGVLAIAASLAVLVLAVGPAGALSCEAHPDASPESIASGTEVLAGEEQLGTFWDRYDFAVIGTVTAIRTDEREGSPTYGATEIDVRVDAVLGTDSAPATTTLRAADPGWMAGYPFELGVAYFVPVLARSPEGLLNWTGPCDPVTPVDDPAVTAGELAPLAGAAGVAFSVPSDDAGPGDTPTDGAGWFVPVTSAVAVGAAIAAVVALRRRPLRSAGQAEAGELLAVGDGDQRVEGGGGPT